MQADANTAARDKLEAVAAVLGCAPTQWSILLFTKKLLYEAINTINKVKANLYDEQTEIIDDSLRKVYICLQVHSTFHLGN